MFKFIRKGHQPNFERQKIQRELFTFRKTVQHGFPNKTSALAWDPVLRLLCIGSSNGSIKVYGQIGVEFYGQHKNIESVITRIEFINGRGKIVSLCDDNSLHLWEITKGYLKEIKAISLEGKLKKISTICVHSNKRNLFIGTEGGNIYLLNLKSFTIINNGTIYQDFILQCLADEYKLNPGAVEVLLERPNNPDEILIGYNRGLLVLWNWKEKSLVEKFISTQQLESACWNDDGSQFISTHNDGSYATWSIENGQKPLTEPITTYGPFPCKSITKLLQKRIGDHNLIAFTGGMPRASYGDKFTVTLIHGEKHTVLDFTSKIIDFVIMNGECTLNNVSNTSITATSVVEENVVDIDENQHPDTLLVLAEEELVAIDLQSDDWNMINLPYLVSLHASAITCSQHVSQVPEDLWNKLKEAGQRQCGNLFSKAAWTINGGCVLDYDNKTNRDLLLTGHEDGTVKFWDASGVALSLLYKMTTANIFCGDEIKDDTFPAADDEQNGEEDEWPSFKKTGIFDPYSDDPRLAIRRILLCPYTETLVICGTSGHVLVAKFENTPSSIDLQPITMNIVSDHDGFVWKGHAKLNLKSNPITQPAGFQIQTLCQIHPPAAITSCVIHSQSNILAAGTAHGLAVLDYLRQTPILVKCTLNPNDALSMGDTPISRRKSFKKSLRESFRRLRKGRSGRNQKQVNNNVDSPSDNKFSNRRGPPINAASSPIEAKPVERQIEARTVDDGMGSMVRCLYFVKTFLINMTTTVLTLWAGTNNGTIHVFTITLPPIAKRKDENVVCQLAKEIQLKHRAPVISIMVLDGSNKPIPEPYETDNDSTIQSDNSQPHRVLIISEEQFKIFTLPSLKPFNKYKLTAYEGSRVRKVAFPKFHCQLTDNTKHTEICLLCLTNLGDFLILSLPDLRRQLNSSAIKREDISGISSLVFTKEGEAFYLHSSSEYQRLTVSATKVTLPKCTIKIIDDDQKSVEEEDSLHNHSGAKVVNGQVSHDLQNSNVSQLTNGSSLGSKESSLTESKVEVNGDETISQNITSTSSVGDITIDSVRDHIGTDLISQLASAAFKSNLNTTNSSNETNDSNVNDNEHKSNDTSNHSTEIN